MNENNDNTDDYEFGFGGEEAEVFEGEIPFEDEPLLSVVAKKVLSGLVGMGVGAVTRSVIKSHMPESDILVFRGIIKASTYTTAWAVKGVVSDFLNDYVEFRVDTTAAAVAEGLAKGRQQSQDEEN